MRPRVKISDVVRVSGVSRATVDRVLNNRAGVKEETRQQVVKALEELGYAPDALSALMRKRPHDVRVFLLDGTNPFFAEIRAGFQRAIAAADTLGIRATCVNFDPYDPASLEHALDTDHDMTAAIVAVGAETTGIAEAINKMRDSGIPVITVISDILSSRRAAHIGQDNFAAGKTAGRLMASMVPKTGGTVGVLIGHVEFKHLLERQSGFFQTMGLMRPDLTLLQTRPYGGSDSDGRAIVEDMFAQFPDLKGVYLSGGGQPHLIEALTHHRTQDQVIIAHELSPLSRRALEQGTFQALVSHDIDHVARLAIEAAIAHTDSPRLAAGAAQARSCGINVYLPENLPKVSTTNRQ